MKYFLPISFLLSVQIYAQVAWNSVLISPNSQRAKSYAVNVLDYGAITNGTGDNSTAFANAAAQLGLGTGGTILVPPGTYNFTNSFAIPRFQSCAVNFQMTGATLTTTNQIPIFSRWPIDQTDANSIVSTMLRFYGGRFIGNSQTNQVGIRLASTFNGEVNGTYFERLDVGLDAYFCLNLSVNLSQAYQCLTSGWRVQSGTNSTTGKGWSGATIGNSPSHCTVFRQVESFASTNELYELGVFSSSDVAVYDSIFEGFNPVVSMLFDSLGSTTVIRTHVAGVHSENTPSDSLAKVALAGTFTLERVYAQNSTTIVNATNAYSGLMVSISEIPAMAGGYIGDVSNGSTISSWSMKNVRGIDVLSTNVWVNGVLPTFLLNNSSETSGTPVAHEYFKSKVIGNPLGTAANDSVIDTKCSLYFLPDDTWRIGVSGQRPSQLVVGTGGVTADASSVSTFGTLVTTRASIKSFEPQLKFGSGETLTSDPFLYIVTTDGQTVTLPCNITSNRVYCIKNVSPAVNTTVNCNLGGLIDGSSSYSMTASNQVIWAIFDKTNYWIIGKYP